MSRRSGTIALTFTITVTLFLAGVVFVLSPGMGDDGYSKEVLGDAIDRQNYSVASVPEPLRTDLEERREEDRMADKVSAILVDDSAFLSDIGDKAAEYVGGKISDLEETYAADTISRIENGDSALMAAIAGSAAASEAYTDEKVASVRKEGEENAAAIRASEATISDMQKEIDSLKAELDALSSRMEDKEAILDAILSDDAFLSSLASEIEKRNGKAVSREEIAEAILGSAALSDKIVEAIEEYHEKYGEHTASIPLPVFSEKEETDYSEDEYIALRNEARNTEISKILDFLGY